MGQTGLIIGQTAGNVAFYVGHAGGFDGSGSQQYVEFLFGKECGSYTSANNTTGTKYYPEIAYVISFRSQSKQGTGFAGAGIQCKSWHNNSNSTSENYDHLSRLGTYDPSDIGNNIHIEYSEDFFGKFSRIAIEKTVTSTLHRARIIITKGEGL